MSAHRSPRLARTAPTARWQAGGEAVVHRIAMTRRDVVRPTGGAGAASGPGRGPGSTPWPVATPIPPPDPFPEPPGPDPAPDPPGPIPGPIDPPVPPGPKPEPLPSADARRVAPAPLPGRPAGARMVLLAVDLTAGPVRRADAGAGGNVDGVAA